MIPIQLEVGGGVQVGLRPFLAVAIQVLEFNIHEGKLTAFVQDQEHAQMYSFDEGPLPTLST